VIIISLFLLSRLLLFHCTLLSTTYPVRSFSFFQHC